MRSLMISIFNFQSVRLHRIIPVRAVSIVLPALFCLWGHQSFAQVTISSGTPVSMGNNVPVVIETTGNVRVDDGMRLNNVQLVLRGTQQNINLSGTLTLSEMELRNGTEVSLTGSDLTVMDYILFDAGIFNPGGNKLLYTGTEILEGNENSYVLGRFTQSGTGVRSFPIASADGIYAPLILEGVAESDVELTAGAFHGNPNVQNIPVEVPDYSENWYWELAESGGFSGATVTLPVLADDEPLFDGQNVSGVVLQANIDRNSVISLGGSLGSSTVKSNELGTGPVFFLGTQIDVQVVIHNIISPNNDGFNDYLVIENLGLLGMENKVILVDRWGVPIYEKENFENFDAIGNPYDGSFDFLEPGNYICILQVPNRETVTQTVTVVKN